MTWHGFIVFLITVAGACAFATWLTWGEDDED